MDGRKALITGASLGLGRAMAERFAGAGAEVAIVARRSELLDTARFEIKQKTGVNVACVPGDVSTADGCQAAYEAARESMGQVDVLVNNAGSSQRGPFIEVTDEIWQADIDLKSLSYTHLTLPTKA